MPHFFLSWLNNADLELNIYFLNTYYGGLERLIFRLLEIFLDLEQIWLSNIERILDHFKKTDGTFSNQF